MVSPKTKNRIQHESGNQKLPKSVSTASNVSSSGGGEKLNGEWTDYADLSLPESLVNWCCAIISIGYVCYRVLILSPTAFKMFVNFSAFHGNADPNFELPRNSLRWVGPARDATNTEWTVFVSFMFKCGWWYPSHLFLSAFLRRLGLGSRWRLFVLAIASFLLFAHYIGVKPTLSHVILGFTCLIVARLTKNVFFVWGVNVFVLVLLNYPNGVPYLGFTVFPYLFNEDTFEYEHYFVWIITSALTISQTISFCHVVIGRKFGQSRKTPFWGYFVDLFNYLYYFPLLLSGPLMIYEDFERDAVDRDETVENGGAGDRAPPKTPSSSLIRFNFNRDNAKKLAFFAANLVRFLFWALLTEAILHRMYMNVMIKRTNFLSDSVDLWELSGIGFTVGQFFYLKYLQLYGFHSLVAHADGFTPPKQPKCIARVYLYSDMWRLFDTGLYKFIQRHMYFPLGGSRHGICRQILASFICFSFIYIWHGSEFYIMLWCIVNFAGIQCEMLGRRFCQTETGRAVAVTLGPRMWRRFRVICAIPLFLTSIIAIFMFIGADEEIGYVFVRRFLLEGGWALLLTMFFLYTIAQTSVDIFKREERTKLVKSD